MHDLARFTLSDMSTCSSALRKMGKGARSMEEAARNIVRFLHENLVQKESMDRSCVLVRLFKTHPLGKLPEDLQAFARGFLGDLSIQPSMKCLTLLGTAGERPEWNCRTRSAGHKAIPLPSEEVVSRFPMISRLIGEFGIEVGTMIKDHPPLSEDLARKSCHVFRVPEARGNPDIPAQEEFVVPCGIRSVIGFGGILHSRNFFAIILFSRAYIPSGTAEMFETLALSAKVAIQPFELGPVFDG
jgi:hypothetical protein